MNPGQPDSGVRFFKWLSHLFSTAVLRRRQGWGYHFYFKGWKHRLSERLGACTEYRGHIVGARPQAPLPSWGGLFPSQESASSSSASLTHPQNLKAEGNRGGPLSPPGRVTGWENGAQLSFGGAAQPPGAGGERERRGRPEGTPSRSRRGQVFSLRQGRGASAASASGPREAAPARGPGHPGTRAAQLRPRPLRAGSLLPLRGLSGGARPQQSGPREPEPEPRRSRATRTAARGQGREDAPRAPPGGGHLRGSCGRAPSRDARGGGCREPGGRAAGVKLPDPRRGAGPRLPAGSGRGGEPEGRFGCCRVELVEGRLRLLLHGPRRAEIESVGGNCREVCWGQYKEESSNHQLSVRVIRCSRRW